MKVSGAWFLVSGFVSVVAIMDWFRRYVLSWELSISLETAFCLTALDRALQQATPEIFNRDQGGPFTSLAFTGVLTSAGIAISMDGRGRVYDNIFIERLWRSVKYDKVYLSDWQEVRNAHTGLDEYFGFYNMLGKFAAVIGPVMMGSVGLLVRSFGASSDMASRVSITSIALLFLAGGILFYFVDEEKARQEGANLA